MECSSTGHKPVKVEAWLSKRYEKKLRQLRGEFAAMGSTRVALWVYPSENPSRIVAMGRCVPVYIAHHIFRKAIEHCGSVNALVNQGFFSPNWIGVGTSLYAESSLQPISSSELARLMDNSILTSSNQSIVNLPYRKRKLRLSVFY